MANPLDKFFDGMESVVSKMEMHAKLTTDKDEEDDIEDAEFVDVVTSKKVPASKNIEDSISHIRTDLYSFYSKNRKNKEAMTEFNSLIEEVHDLLNP